MLGAIDNNRMGKIVSAVNLSNTRKEEKMANKAAKEKIDNLEQIKRLLILGLIRSGVQGKDIANILGIDPATISRMIPVRSVKDK